MEASFSGAAPDIALQWRTSSDSSFLPEKLIKVQGVQKGKNWTFLFPLGVQLDQGTLLTQLRLSLNPEVNGPIVHIGSIRFDR